MNSTLILSPLEQEHLLEKLEVFKIQGRDKRGRKLLLITGKQFPARVVSSQVLKKYLEEKIFPSLGEKPFSIVYMHTGFSRNDNFPGISILPINVRDNLHSFYFLHPTLQSRIFLATFGRLFFTGGLYGKVKFVTRVEFLWEDMRRNEIEIPEFVYAHDEELEYRPMTTDYNLESDHPRIYNAPLMESSVAMYSMRCIA
ncbi:hypothetical protein ACFE04_014740 [Oxalis oulophora]